jgi:hypothetical protein
MTKQATSAIQLTAAKPTPVSQSRPRGRIVTIWATKASTRSNPCDGERRLIRFKARTPLRPSRTTASGRWFAAYNPPATVSATPTAMIAATELVRFDPTTEAAASPNAPSVALPIRPLITSTHAATGTLAPNRRNRVKL